MRRACCAAWQSANVVMEEEGAQVPEVTRRNPM